MARPWFGLSGCSIFFPGSRVDQTAHPSGENTRCAVLLHQEAHRPVVVPFYDVFRQWEALQVGPESGPSTPVFADSFPGRCPGRFPDSSSSSPAPDPVISLAQKNNI